MVTVELADTPFKKLTKPKQYKHIQNISRFTEFISNVIMQQSNVYPVTIHLPTGILLNTFVEINTPVIAPSGDSNNDNPRLPSVKPSLYLMVGIAATQVPNNKLEEANKKPTASTGFNFIKEKKFFSITASKLKDYKGYQKNYF